MRRVLSAVVVAMAWLTSSLCGAQSLLLDDFSIPQQGIVTDVFAAFDVLEDPNLFLGAREVWGGGRVGCQASMMSVTVQEGEFRASSGEDCPGTAVASWPPFGSDASVDLSAYSGVLIDVTAVTGEVDLRVSFNHGQTLVGSTVHLPSLVYILLPDSVYLSDINRISVGALVGSNGSIAIDSIGFVVPEPAMATSLAATLVLSCVAGRRRMR